MNEENQSAANGMKQLNWPTVILILVSGGGNWLATQHGNTTISFEQQESIRNIRELHAELDDFKKWQKQAGDNQQQMMQNDANLLGEVLQIVSRLDRLKTLDEMRGAPSNP